MQSVEIADLEHLTKEKHLLFKEARMNIYET